MGKDIMSAIEERTSTRHYLPDEIDEEVIHDILEAAHEAPSAGNLQPWEFYVVKDKEKIEELATAAYEQDWLAEAPVVIAVCGLAHISANKYGKRGADLYVVQDTAAAVENMLLAAEEHDLGSCWVGAFAENKVKEILQIKEESWPVALVSLGYSQEEAEEEPQRSLDDLVTFIQ